MWEWLASLTIFCLCLEYVVSKEAELFDEGNPQTHMNESRLFLPTEQLR